MIPSVKALKSQEVGSPMGVLKADDHEALRMWASENEFGDPESLIDRKDGKLLFRSARAAKQYRRLEAMYKGRNTQNAQTT